MAGATSKTVATLRRRPHVLSDRPNGAGGIRIFDEASPRRRRKRCLPLIAPAPPAPQNGSQGNPKPLGKSLPSDNSWDWPREERGRDLVHLRRRRRSRVPRPRRHRRAPPRPLREPARRRLMERVVRTTARTPGERGREFGELCAERVSAASEARRLRRATPRSSRRSTQQSRARLLARSRSAAPATRRALRAPARRDEAGGRGRWRAQSR